MGAGVISLASGPAEWVNEVVRYQADRTAGQRATLIVSRLGQRLSRSLGRNWRRRSALIYRNIRRKAFRRAILNIRRCGTALSTSLTLERHLNLSGSTTRLPSTNSPDRAVPRRRLIVP